MKFKHLGIIAGSLFSFCSFGQVSMEEIVVTGTKTPKLVSEAPVRTEFINSNELKKIKPKDASQVVRLIPGLDLKNLIGREGLAPVIQGLGDDHVLVLVDGVPYSSQNARGVDLTQIAGKEIERVEVIKGAASSLYGSSAMGGVINIFTKDSKKPFEYNLNLESSILGGDTIVKDSNIPNALINAQIGGKGSNFFYGLKGSKRDTNNYDLNPNTISWDGNDSSKYDFSIKSGFDSGSWLVSGEYRLFHENVESIGAEKKPGLLAQERISSTKTLKQAVLFNYNQKLKESKNIKMIGRYEWVSDLMNLGDNPQTSYRETEKEAKQRLIGFESQYDFVLWEGHLITLGTSMQNSFLDKENRTSYSNDRIQEKKEVDNKDSTSMDLFVQDDIVFKNFEFVPGARMEWNNGFGIHMAPKISMRYVPEILTQFKPQIRASVGTGYRIPSLKERYFILDHRAMAGYIVLGNEFLKPETSLSYQAGLELTFPMGISLNTNLFLNNIENLIVTKNSAPEGGEKTFLYENVNQAQTRGFEVSVGQNYFNRLESNLSFTYNEAMDVSLNKFLPYRPFYLIKGGLRFHFWEKGPSTSFEALFRDNEYTNEENTKISKGYIKYDLKFDVPFGNDTEFYFGIENLSNVIKNGREDFQGQEVDNRPDRGRAYSLGVNLKG